ncbi:MAG: S8 family serine peptidase [Planctomycetes bacterium]|nr:S8 family serine peptidase [Planctomycetota bacterium]
MNHLESRALLVGAAAFVLSATAWSQDRVSPAELIRNRVPIQGVSPLTPPLEIRATTTEAPEPESAVPFELRDDPTGFTADGDVSGTAPIPDHLKGNPYRLAFVAGEFTPPTSQKLDPALAADWQRHAPEKSATYGFLMFEGRITAAKLARVAALGVEIGEFHTFQSHKAKIPYSAIPDLIGSQDLRWIGYAPAWQKVHPELKAVVQDAPTGRAFAFINVFESDITPNAERKPMHDGEASSDANVDERVPTVLFPHGPIESALTKLGVRVVDYYDGLRCFLVDLPLGQVETIASMDVVHSLELCQELTHDHDRSTRQIGVDYVRSTSAADGSTALVGLLDSGAYMGGGRHFDLNKYGVGWNFGGTASVWNDTDGHGTHVLGTVCGTGSADKRYRGCAPSAGSTSNHRIFVGRVFDASNYPNNLPGAYSQFSKAYKDGNSVTTQRPHVINNSYGYGSATAAGYPGTDSISRAVDQYVYSYGQNYVFSASNTGGSSFSGEILKSLRRPNVAKNAFSVANAMDYKLDTTSTVGRIWYSSGKGPTSDGRMKPNINAPGNSIRSCRNLTTNQYVNKSGTSMAAPHITGVIAGLVDHYPSTFAYRPYAQKAWVAATANPRNGTYTFTSTDQAYYYRQGLGQVDAYKTHYQANTTTGWTSGWSYGTLTSSSAGSYFDVTVPADATRTFFVLNFDEKESSASATRACLADLDLYLDVDGNQSGYNTGEYSSRRAWDTWEWYGNWGSIASVRGKKIRVKIYPRVRPASGTTCKWSVGYVFYRGDQVPVAGTVSLSGSTLLKPNQTGTITATVTVPETTQNNSLLELSSYSGFSIKSLSFRSGDDLVRTYPPTGGSFDSIYNWTIGNLGYWYPSSKRQMTWTYSRSTSASSSICVRLTSDNRSSSGNGTYTACRTICVDGLAPNTISGLASTSHTVNAWSNNASLAMKWNTATDNGCAGILGVATKTSLGGASSPTTRNLGNVTTQTVTLGSSTSGQYFNARAVDKLNTFSSSNAASGPYYIDLTKPSITSVTLDNNATRTPDLVVDFRVTASDSYSGASQMRFSGNGSTWTPWRAYSTAAQSINLASYGASTTEGTKTGYVQVRDKAGNISATARDTISYVRPPKIASASPTSMPNITNGYFTLSGSDFVGTTRVLFGSRSLTSQSPDEWYQGYFRVVSDTTLHVYPPQAMATGSYAIRADAIWSSNTVSVTLVHQTKRVLHSPTQLKLGKTLYLVSARADMPTNTFDFLTLSLSNRPLVIPGIVSLSHGGNPTTFIDPTYYLLAAANFHDGTTRAAVWKLPTVVAANFYFQSIKFDPANINFAPLRTSTLTQTRIY